MPPTARRWGCSAALLVTCLTAASCGARDVDLAKALQIAGPLTGWFDAGIVDGKNKLVPSITFKLKNVGPDSIASVQLNAVFHRVGEEEEWGSAYVRAIGGGGLAAGAETPSIVLRCPLGYTGEQPRAEMLQHREFRDATVDIFAKHGSAQWLRLGRIPIQRHLLTR